MRRRVQTEQTGHRGRRDDPLYRVRRALLTGEEKLDEKATARLASLLQLGDPEAEVAIAYRVKERLRDFYRTFDATEARAMLEELKGHCLKPAMPPEIQKLGRTIKHWFEKICNFHLARVSNGPTESINNLIASSASVSAFETSRTTASEPCFMPANRTGACSARSWSDEAHPVRIR